MGWSHSWYFYLPDECQLQVKGYDDSAKYKSFDNREEAEQLSLHHLMLILVKMQRKKQPDLPLRCYRQQS